MKSDLASWLREQGFRATAGRIALLEVLAEAKAPLTVTALLEDKRLKTIDQVTLYRALESFEGKGMVRRISFNDRAQYFELAHDHHHHAVCTECGHVEDIHDDSFEQFVHRASAAVKGFKEITNHSFELFGVCTACARRS